ncbi:hypothetical protein BH23CHL9_BH23CHL9_15720 [soil metagenome]|jgi:hypothetical protein
MEQRNERLPLPSEDTGDLTDEPRTGQTDDYLVAHVVDDVKVSGI